MERAGRDLGGGFSDFFEIDSPAKRSVRGTGLTRAAKGLEANTLIMSLVLLVCAGR